MARDVDRDEDRELLGIHHVTAIAGDPQENADFYVGVLGLRLVKKTVNQDDPTTYHLFYADAVGHPGTDLTFFPWPGARHGKEGPGQTVSVALAIPAAALSYWTTRLKANHIPFVGPSRRFDEDVIVFSDPHAMPVELIAGPGTEHRELWTAWESGPVPPEFAIRGIHGVTIKEAQADPTRAFLIETLGFRPAGDAEGRLRFTTGRGGSGAILDLLPTPGEDRGQVAVGSIHHVAWRTPDAAQQQRWWERIGTRGLSVSPIIDRFWFSSIYFSEPGGALFEIATDGPGFTRDERPEDLGDRLILPVWLEPRRAQIERALPLLRAPDLR
ncbi:MAG: ring-cleaving dioxygenase [Armatimonadota bacterium]